MRKGETSFNPDTDKQLAFPTDIAVRGHIKALEGKEYKEGRYVFTPTVLIADENAGTLAPLSYMEDGDNGRIAVAVEGKKIDLQEFAGREIEGEALFFDKNPKEKYLNAKYFQQFSNMGVAFRKDKEGGFFLDEIEEADVFGLPVIVKAKIISKRNKQSGVTYKQLLITSYVVWDSGDRLDATGFEERGLAPF